MCLSILSLVPDVFINSLVPAGIQEYRADMSNEDLLDDPGRDAIEQVEGGRKGRKEGGREGGREEERD